MYRPTKVCVSLKIQGPFWRWKPCLLTPHNVGTVKQTRFFLFSQASSTYTIILSLPWAQCQTFRPHQVRCTFVRVRCQGSPFQGPEREPGTFFRHLSVSRILMTDRQIIDVLENTDGLMVSTEDEKAREWSRDCASMERWRDDMYNGTAGKKVC